MWAATHVANGSLRTPSLHSASPTAPGSHWLHLSRLRPHDPAPRWPCPSSSFLGAPVSEPSQPRAAWPGVASSKHRHLVSAAHPYPNPSCSLCSFQGSHPLGPTCYCPHCLPSSSCPLVSTDRSLKVPATSLVGAGGSPEIGQGCGWVGGWRHVGELQRDRGLSVPILGATGTQLDLGVLSTVYSS